MENDVIKCVFSHLQEIKIIKNNFVADVENSKRLLEKLENITEQEEIEYNKIFEEFYTNKYKFILRNIMTFGVHFLKNKDTYYETQGQLDYKLFKIEESLLNMSLIQKSYNSDMIEKNKKITQYDKYIDQLYNFMKCVSSLEEEDKNRVLSIK